MAGFYGEGASSGAIAGAGLGAMGGPKGALIGAALGGAAGAFGLLGRKPKYPNIDISGELARVMALYEQARQAGRAAVTQDFQAQRGELANTQAARGILRSPISSAGLERLGAARTQALAQLDANLLGSQAGVQSQLLQALMGQRQQRDLALYQQGQARQNALLGLGGGALSSALRPKTTAQGGQGFNFADSNFMAPNQSMGQSFYQSEFRGY